MFFLQMAGFPGAGKSTLAKEIAKQTGCIIVDHDISKTSLMTSFQELQLDERHCGKISYEMDFSLVDFYLGQGRSVILDSPCLYDDILEKGQLLAEKHHAAYKFIECYLDDFEEVNKRLQSRNRYISQIEKCASPENLQRTNEQCKKPLNHHFLTVRTGAPMDTYLVEVMEYVRG
jgi:predicted kinase